MHEELLHLFILFVFEVFELFLDFSDNARLTTVLSINYSNGIALLKKFVNKHLINANVIVKVLDVRRFEYDLLPFKALNHTGRALHFSLDHFNFVTDRQLCTQLRHEELLKRDLSVT